MATSAPQHKAPPGWVDQRSADSSGIDAKELEIGISGINISGFTGSNRPPTLSGSSVSTNPDGTHSRQHSFGSFNGNTDHTGGHRGTPPSPASPMYRGQSTPSLSNQSRPPGLGGPFPSPIGKAGSVNSTAVSSPHLTLTPSSSVDGSSEIFATGKQTSPFTSEGSFIPSYSDQLTEEGRNLGTGGGYLWGDPSAQATYSGAFGFGEYRSAFSASMDNDDYEDDGLAGLGALRERAHSSPGPLMSSGGFGGGHLSSSPPIRTDAPSFRMSGSPLHMESGAFRDDSSGNRNYPSDPRRTRRDGQSKAISRPPLSGGISASHSLYHEGNMSFGSNQGDRSHDMSRTDWLDGNRGRSISMGTLNTRDMLFQDGQNVNENYRAPPHLDQAHAQKFGSLPNLSTHVHQQQRLSQHMQQQFGGLQPPAGHVRSISQPGPNMRGFIDSNERYDNPHGFDHALEYSPARGDSHYYADEGESLHSGVARGDEMRYVQQGHPGHLARSVSAGNNIPNMHGTQRNLGSSRQSASSGAFEELRMGRQNSHSGAMNHYGHQRQPSLPDNFYQRRDGLEFLDDRSSNQGNAIRPIIATREEMEMFGVYGNDRGGYNGGGPAWQERQPQSAGIHSRHHSDGGGVLTAAMSQGNRNGRGGQGHYSRHSSGNSSPISSQYGQSPAFDDDQLAGEYIDDPDDDGGELYGSNPHQMPGVYGMNDQVQPRGHNSRHSFSSTSSLEQMPHGGVGRHYEYNQVETHRQPTAGQGGSGPKVVYNIKFKRTQRNFVAGPRVSRDLDIGSYVKVEADRGEDLGIVVGKMPAEKCNSSGRPTFRSGGPPGGEIGMGAPAPPSPVADLKRVIRLATHDEVNLLAVKREEEDELLNICRTKVRQRALPMNVVDAEYQFDRHKLTFFFEAEGRVDFRELVRDLFSIYKTRIWMQQLDKNGSGGASAGVYGSAGDGGGGGEAGSSGASPRDKERN